MLLYHQSFKIKRYHRFPMTLQDLYSFANHITTSMAQSIAKLRRIQTKITLNTQCPILHNPNQDPFCSKTYSHEFQSIQTQHYPKAPIFHYKNYRKPQQSKPFSLNRICDNKEDKIGRNARFERIREIKLDGK